MPSLQAEVELPLHIPPEPGGGSLHLPEARPGWEQDSLGGGSAGLRPPCAHGGGDASSSVLHPLGLVFTSGHGQPALLLFAGPWLLSCSVLSCPEVVSPAAAIGWPGVVFGHATFPRS